ncbi:hypothetical protein [Edaphobacter bradus]|uniref:hypothetical protein n=1 Tax=Edaphobacter bradus TaxID=2259016 RepID=UPI0021DF6B9B|nr:hypothetical protein [Edaphobacter bradus]
MDRTASAPPHAANTTCCTPIASLISVHTLTAKVGKTLGESFFGSFIGSFNKEFLPDVLTFAHLKKYE